MPCCRLFKKIQTEKLNAAQQKQICRYVDGQKGYKVTCGGVSCVFEFEAYEFCGYEPDDDDTLSGISSEARPEMHFNGAVGRPDASLNASSHTALSAIEAVAVDMEPPLPDLQAWNGSSASAGQTGMTGSAGVAGTQSETVSLASYFSTSPNELPPPSSSAASELRPGIARAGSIVGSEPSEPVAGRVNPPVANGLNHTLGNGSVPEQTGNSHHSYQTNGLVTGPNLAFRASQTSDLAMHGSSTSGLAFDDSRTSDVAVFDSRRHSNLDKNSAATPLPYHEPDNSQHFGQSTPV